VKWNKNLMVLAAIEEDEQRTLEEEEMTRYMKEELEDDWEFKIIRSWRGEFRDPEVMEGVLEEEGKYGWVMLEKLDDSRIRLKRPRSARNRDQRYIDQGEDPYRTTYSSTPQQIAARGGLLTFIMVVLIVIVVIIIFALR